MRVDLKCFSSLASEDSCDYKDSTSYELEDGKTVGDLIDRAGLDRGGVKVAFVNSRTVGLETVLHDGDRVGLAPPVGGM
jgi:molybdopterin converting factor small subunit